MTTSLASFYNKKTHQDTHAHIFTMQFTELTYGFKDVLPDCIIFMSGYVMKTKLHP